MAILHHRMLAGVAALQFLHDETVGDVCCPAAAHLSMSTMTTPQRIRSMLPTAYVIV
jgi:hypothetical protein